MEAEEVEEERSRRHCPLATAGPMAEVEGAGLGGQQRSVRKMEEEEGEAGDGDGDDGEEEGAGDLPWWEEVAEVGHPEFLVWREAEEEVPRRGLWKEAGEEGLPCHLWRAEEEEEGVEPSCGEAEGEEGDRHEKEVEGVLQEEMTDRHFINTSSDDVTQTVTC